MGSPARRRRIGYFGGSFDPPHRGHVAIAEAASQRLALDEVLFAPTGRQPLKTAGAHASFADRLSMVELLCAERPGTGRATGWQASTIDGPHPDGSPNYTADALEALARDQPAAELFAIIGADSVEHFHRWYRLDRLLELADWVLVSRPGFSASAAMPPGARVHRISDVAVPVASHRLRERLAAGEACRAEIPAPILRYIHEHGLYGASSALLQTPASR